MTKNLKFLKSLCLFVATMISVALVSCVDDNDDTQAPYLEVSPTTLTFGSDGQPTGDSQNYFEISTNREWTATVQAGNDWITLSQTQGEGSTKVNVSIPAGINDEASVLIQISNKVGVLMSQTVVIKSGSVAPVVSIFNETAGSTSVSSPYPTTSTYDGWNTTGQGASSVTYSGVNTSVRASGLANTDSYNGASGPNVIFFGTAPSSFTVNKITLTSEETNLQLTFGASYSLKGDDGVYDNIFNVDNFKVELSADGILWSPLSYTKNTGDQESPYWILATADFTLAQPATSLYIRFTSSVSSAIRLDDISLSTGTGGTSIDLGKGSSDGESGGDTPGGGDTPDDGTTTNPFTMTSADIVSDKTGSEELPTNNYGSQNVATPSTWYTWKSNGIDFTGVKMCVATAANGGGIQLQGNASAVDKQGRIANVSAMKEIQSIVITLKVVSTSTFDPAYNLYVGTSANPSETAITSSVVKSEADGFRTYVETFDLTGGSYTYFNIMNNLTGAIYIDSIKITTK